MGLAGRSSGPRISFCLKRLGRNFEIASPHAAGTEFLCVRELLQEGQRIEKTRLNILIPILFLIGELLKTFAGHICAFIILISTAYFS